jgi:hypothetical protein
VPQPMNSALVSMVGPDPDVSVGRAGLPIPSLGYYALFIPPVASVAGCEARFGGPLRFSPGVRLGDGPVGIMNHLRQLALAENVHTQLLEEGSLQPT